MPADHNAHHFGRSPALLDRNRAALVVVDVQEKLLPVVRDAGRVAGNIGRLLEAAGLWRIPVLVSEQYPRGLGKTVDQIAEKLPTPRLSVCEKLDFSCWGCEEFRHQLHAVGRRQIVVVGIETHVCVQQTVLDLTAAGYQTFVVVDAVSSRAAMDHDVALRRMTASTVIAVTAESVLFEWCERAGSPEFKRTSALVKDFR
ncbi:MAG: hydrolase [Pirellulales bacterium]